MIVEALDIVEYSEERRVLPPGTTAGLEADLYAERSQFRDGLLILWPGPRAAGERSSWSRSGFPRLVRDIALMSLPDAERKRYLRMRDTAARSYERDRKRRMAIKRGEAVKGDAR